MTTLGQNCQMLLFTESLMDIIRDSEPSDLGGKVIMKYEMPFRCGQTRSELTSPTETRNPHFFHSAITLRSEAVFILPENASKFEQKLGLPFKPRVLFTYDNRNN